MNLYRSIRTVTRASGTGPVDWTAVGDAAKAATTPGSLDLSTDERMGYATDVGDARSRVHEISTVEFDLPDAMEIQNRHHWIDANIDTFRRVMESFTRRGPAVLPDFARILNTGTMTFTFSFLARNVLGQYDPLLLAEGDDHALYFVHPNIRRVADELDVSYPRFRRWIAFHEVTHAAEFGSAPWLTDHLESRLQDGIDALSHGTIDRDAFRELDAAMTAVEGYAELLMDEAFDEEYEDLRQKLDQRRQQGGPVAQLVRRFLGLGLKRRQYERGKAFFTTVVDRRGISAAGAVWDRPENLPRSNELAHPLRWITRVDP